MGRAIQCKCQVHYNCTTCPNWFYYWKEGDVCSIPQNSLYTNTTANEGIVYSGEWKRRLNRIFLGSGAPSVQTKIAARSNAVHIVEMRNTFEIADIEVSDVVIITNVLPVRFCIGAEGLGVRSVAATVKHELRHQDIGLSNPHADDIRIEIDGEEVDDYGDSDFDTVLDVDEEDGKWGIVTEVGCTDTYNMAGVDPLYLGFGDNEVCARIAEEENLDSAYKVDRDWANPGCQSLKPGGPNLTR